MVTINVAIEDGGGYIHLISSEEVRFEHVGDWDGVETQCGFMLENDATLCDARDATDVIWKDQPFDPHDLADLILRLKDDGYMCRECVREHWRAVGGIAGLYHHPWTQDLHREDGHEDEDLKPVHASVELDGGVTVMRVGNQDGGAVMVNGDCPTCSSALSVASEGHETKTVMCTKCTWRRAVDLPEP